MRWCYKHNSTPDRLQEIENRGRYLIILNVASAQFVSDLNCRVAGPPFSGIEDNDPGRIVILTRKQVADQRLATSALFIGLVPGPTEWTKVI